MTPKWLIMSAMHYNLVMSMNKWNVYSTSLSHKVASL